jgi:seryl-tRNA(Sec) selenium transferase
MMLTTTERAIIQILKVLKVTKETITGIMLTLKDYSHGQNLLMKFLRESDPGDLTEETILHKVDEIAQKKN